MQLRDDKDKQYIWYSHILLIIYTDPLPASKNVIGKHRSQHEKERRVTLLQFNVFHEFSFHFQLNKMYLKQTFLIFIKF